MFQRNAHFFPKKGCRTRLTAPNLWHLKILYSMYFPWRAASLGPSCLPEYLPITSMSSSRSFTFTNRSLPSVRLHVDKSVCIVNVNELGSVADPWHFGTYPDQCLWPMDPDPAFFVIDLQDTNTKVFFFEVFLLIAFLRYIYIIFQREKVIRKSQNNRNQGFS